MRMLDKNPQTRVSVNEVVSICNLGWTYAAAAQGLDVKTEEVEILRKNLEEERRKREEVERELYLVKYPTITLLDELTVVFPQSDGIKREGNTIIHHGPTSWRNCFIGGVMTSVRQLYSLPILFLPSFLLSLL